jgi:hypothetical protein
MLRSAKRITPNAVLIPATEAMNPMKRMSFDPLRCGGIGGLEVYHSVSQGVEGCMNNAKSAAAEPSAVSGGNDIRSSASTIVHEMEQDRTIENGVRLNPALV